MSWEVNPSDCESKLSCKEWKECVQQLQAGMTAAWSCVVNGLALKLYKEWVASGTSAADRDDAATATALRIKESIGSLEKLDDFEAWVRRIFVNECSVARRDNRVRVRGRRRVPMAPEGHMTDSFPHLLDPLHEQLRMRRNRARLLAAIEPYDSDTRTVVRLHLLGDCMELQEIARALRWTLDRVRRLWRQIRPVLLRRAREWERS